ncbi:DUF4395 domain-containing protein [Microbacterium sp. MYb66]|jgi:hypothetical protein|uniref:DUF4395 domain-containing protein n=1 Tax=Microbacterium sp. MYb66 TaxID=1848692 RepID=UPI000CFFC0D6|nr:DUF4395 domain-containing protein [Microbacterium sp. MYb66]PRA83178.1 hypothetical protein CQ045_01950 [Microbacterium sp. MYb66]
MTAPTGIDPRGPRFAATLTAILLLVATFLALIGISTARLPGTWFAISPSTDFAFIGGKTWAISSATLAQRVLDPGFLLTVVIALLFLWGVVSPRTAPWGVVFRTLVRPRLAPPGELEDPRPPRFSQGVGLFVVSVGLLLHLVGVPWALPIATAAAFIAAFLNAAFAFCLGCQLYLLLQRAGVVGREPATS